MLNKVTKIVLAPNAFKECLSASQACNAMQIGIDKAFNSNSLYKQFKYEIKHVPLADGGDGTMDILIENNKGSFINTTVQDPVGRNINSKYGIFQLETDKFKTAVIEMADASGLWRMSEHEKNPLYTHTFGTGELILNALNTYNDIGRVIICIGGSATNDAGFGMATAFGITFNYNNDDDNGYIVPSNASLNRINSINKSSLKSFQDKYNINNIDFIVGCDVNNPLLGSNGATYVYAPQKLSDEYILSSLWTFKQEINQTDDEFIQLQRKYHYELMENNLKHMNNVWINDLGINVNEIDGSGAAGGLASGLMIYLNAKIESGFEIVAKYAALDDALKDADLVITGEGSIDSSTSAGKVPVGVAKHAYQFGISSISCIAGIVKMDNQQETDEVVSKTDDDVQIDKEKEAIADIIPFSIANGPMTLENSIKNASKLVTETAYRICQLFLSSRQ